VTGVDLPRLIGRLAITREALDDAEHRHALALEDAEYLSRPRVKVVDRDRRIVRVQNAPTEAVESPPRTRTYQRGTRCSTAQPSSRWRSTSVRRRRATWIIG
jgi:hypothetical protein